MSIFHKQRRSNLKVLFIKGPASLETELKLSLNSASILNYEAKPVSEKETEFTFIVEREPGKEFDAFIDDTFTDSTVRKMYKIDLRVRHKKLRQFTDTYTIH